MKTYGKYIIIAILFIILVIVLMLPRDKKIDTTKEKTLTEMGLEIE